jgi:PAS domain S-box-containing protein
MNVEDMRAIRTDIESRLDFLAGGGEMGAMTRAYPWHATPLGAPDTWPQSLRTSVRLLFNTRHPMFIWWGPELIQFYNDAYRQTMGPERHPSALGQRGRECWEEIWPIIGPQIDLVMKGEGATWHEDALVPVTRHGKREDVWWTYSYSPIDDETKVGGVGGVLVVCNDVTGRHRAMEALRVSKERLQLALDAGVVGVWDWHIAEDRFFADEKFARLYGVDPELAAAGAPLRAFIANIHPDDVARVEIAIEKTVRTGGEYSSEYRLRQPDNSVRWVLARGYCLRDENGKPVRFPGAAVDISERKEAEEHRELLANELNHRVKNLMATVQAIANQSLREGTTLETARTAFGGRLKALANAQDVLMGGRGVGAADLGDVIKGAIEPFAEDISRFRLDGCPVRLGPRSTLAVAMATHELCTNAAKYGALSQQGGQVDISWQIVPSADGDQLELRWTESGGPAVVPPARKGFGARLVEHGLAAQLGGDAQVAYDPAGVVCTVRAPVKSLEQDFASGN